MVAGGSAYPLFDDLHTTGFPSRSASRAARTLMMGSKGAAATPTSITLDGQQLRYTCLNTWPECSLESVRYRKPQHSQLALNSGQHWRRRQESDRQVSISLKLNHTRKERKEGLGVT
jgi:hypothetical protein